MRSPFASMLSVDPFGDRLQPGPGAAFVVLVAFLLAFAAPLEAPWWHLAAVAFGVGAGEPSS